MRKAKKSSLRLSLLVVAGMLMMAMATGESGGDNSVNVANNDDGGGSDGGGGGIADELTSTDGRGHGGGSGRGDGDDASSATTTSSSSSSSSSHRHHNHSDNNKYLVGTGIYDATGPAAQINFMGYAKPAQTGHGIHTRLRSRAYIVSEVVRNEDKKKRTVDGEEEEKEEMAAKPTATTAVASSRAERKASEEEAASEEEEDPMEENGSSAGSGSSYLRRSLLRSKWNPWRRDDDHGNNDDNKTHNPMAESADPDKTVCFVSLDVGMGSDLLTTRVLARLQELLPVVDNDNQGTKRTLCHRDNLSISGTHTHSAPGGFLQYALYQMTSHGYSEETMTAYVEGVSQSIVRAYESMQPGGISVATGMLHGANINRSPTSYVLNPESERSAYNEEGDTDKRMVHVRFFASSEGDGNGNGGALNGASTTTTTTTTSVVELGAINWFAVHGTSMNSTNTLISGDNKGYASYLMEKHFNGPNALPGTGPFVGAFASTNLGDVSPNTAGPKCLDTGLPCDGSTSTCNGKNELCIAPGPGRDMFESTEIIGRKQYDLALALHQEASSSSADVLEGEVSYRHSYVDMSNRVVRLDDGTTEKTCPAALGYSFAAGTTDGPGDFDFSQGTDTSNAFWNMVGGFLSTPTNEQKECHHPKPILLNTGNVKEPYAWDPKSVPISIQRIGKLLILNVPAEFTTMAGRRLRSAVTTIATSHGVADPIVTIAGLSNSYTHYVTTFEEYAGQRYEAASTLYGPHTLMAYVREFERIATDLFNNRPSTSDEPPDDLSKHQLSLITSVVLDVTSPGKKFGSIKVDANDEYVAGDDTVQVSFHSANPRNDRRIEGTYLTVDRLDDEDEDENEGGSTTTTTTTTTTTSTTWSTKYVDGDWCTRYEWEGNALGVSFAHVTWEIPENAPEGRYRICHYGTRKTLWADVGTKVPWLVSSDGSFGASALEFFARLYNMAATCLAPFRRSLSRLKEFEGCSKVFVVKSK